MIKKTTLVLGASPNPDRFSYKAIKSLRSRNIPVIAIGLRDSEIGDIKIRKQLPGDAEHVHTLALYMNAKNQAGYYDFILSLRPDRIIFNPGTWNAELAGMAQNKGIEVVDDCMLAMLGCGQF